VTARALQKINLGSYRPVFLVCQTLAVKKHAIHPVMLLPMDNQLFFNDLFF
jgi:hypothetical protein